MERSPMEGTGPERRLDTLHAAWEDAGRPKQKGVAWSRSAWRRALPARAALFAQLPDLIGKDTVAGYFTPKSVEAAVTDAFVVAMVWGHGSTGYGAWRTNQILTNNADPARQLLDACQTAWKSPIDAYTSMGYKHRNRLIGLGPAFGTKFISYAAASNNLDAPILDALTASWVAQYADVTFAPAVWRPTEYSRYLDLIGEWADHLSETPTAVEFLMFADASKNLSASRRRENQWAEPWVPPPACI
jgi:hypothetical protein